VQTTDVECAMTEIGSCSLLLLVRGVFGQKTPSAQVTNVSAGEQRLALPAQLREQEKHDNPAWHCSSAVQTPHSPTVVVLH
jgi:hypothetical protein